MKIFLFAVGFFIITQTGLCGIADSVRLNYLNGRYFECITEAKRLLFFTQNQEEKLFAEYLIGRSYLYGGFFTLSHDYFRNAELQAPTLLLQWLSARNRALLFYLSGNTDAALKYIVRYISSTNNTVAEQAVYWRTALSLLTEKEGQLLLHGKFPELEELQKRYFEERKSELPYVLGSILLPGSGQIVAGEVTDGLLSAVWVGATGYLMGYNISQDKITEGLLTGYFLFGRFYGGNIENTQQLVSTQNKRLYADIHGKIAALLHANILDDEKVFFQ